MSINLKILSGIEILTSIKGQNVGWSFIIQFHDLFSCQRITLGGRGALELSQRSFPMLGYHPQLVYMAFQTCCIGFKSKESLGHSNTDVPLISQMCFVVLELIQRTLLAYSITNSFRIIYWHVKPYRRGLEYHKRRCESLPNNK